MAPAAASAPDPAMNNGFILRNVPKFPNGGRPKNTASGGIIGFLRRLLSQSETNSWIRGKSLCCGHFPIWTRCKLQIFNILAWKFERYFCCQWCSYCNDPYCVRVLTTWRSTSRRLWDSQSLGFPVALILWTGFWDHAHSFPGLWTRPAI